MSEEKTHGLNFKCGNCKVTGHLDFSKWKIRFTGAMEIECPRCHKITTMIGKFGQDIYLERAADDLEKHKDEPA